MGTSVGTIQGIDKAGNVGAPRPIPAPDRTLPNPATGKVVETPVQRAEKRAEDKLAKQIGGIQKKLSNEAFVSRAPEHVVAKERERLAGLEGQLARIDDGLKELA